MHQPTLNPTCDSSCLYRVRIPAPLSISRVNRLPTCRRFAWSFHPLRVNLSVLGRRVDHWARQHTSRHSCPRTPHAYTVAPSKGLGVIVCSLHAPCLPIMQPPSRMYLTGMNDIGALVPPLTVKYAPSSLSFSLSLSHGCVVLRQRGLSSRGYRRLPLPPSAGGGVVPQGGRWKPGRTWPGRRGRRRLLPLLQENDVQVRVKFS